MDASLNSSQIERNIVKQHKKTIFQWTFTFVFLNSHSPSFSTTTPWIKFIIFHFQFHKEDVDNSRKNNYVLIFLLHPKQSNKKNQRTEIYINVSLFYVGVKLLLLMDNARNYFFIRWICMLLFTWLIMRKRFSRA